jgi:membrane protein DedA with SNARE-associated domain
MVLLGVGALLVAAALAYVGVSVHDAADSEAADAGIALLLVAAVIVVGVVFGGLRYLRRGRSGARR